MKKLKHKNFFYIIICGICFLLLLIYLSLPYLILQMSDDYGNFPLVSWIYCHFPRHITIKAARLGLDEKQSLYVIKTTIDSLTHTYSLGELQQFDSYFIKLLKVKRRRVRNQMVGFYYRGNRPLSSEVLKSLENIFYNKTEDLWIRILAGEMLLAKCYQNRAKTVKLLETYNNLTAIHKTGLIFELTDGKNKYHSFIKINGKIYRGDWKLKK